MRHLALLLMLLVALPLASAQQAEPAEDDEEASEQAADSPFESPYLLSQRYRTPLAGEAYSTRLFGTDIEIPARQRQDATAVNLGVQFLIPEIAEQSVVPFGAFFLRRYWEADQRRLRAVLAGLVNSVEFADGTWNDRGLEALASWHNHTIPLPTTEVVNGEEVEESEVEQGNLRAGLGMGWRHPVFPGHFDNWVGLQLRYELGYFYVSRTENTSEEFELPPDTTYQRIRLLGRWDAFERNILELLHRGWGAGIEFEFTVRDRWDDFGRDGAFQEEDTKLLYRLFGYLSAAIDVPFLSERHRLLGFCHWGWAPPRNVDRFSAFRAGGGPPQTEAADLGADQVYPGALFESIPVERYLILTVEYRFELLFFLYLHLRGTLAWAKVGDLSRATGDPDFQTKDTQAFSVGITSGFLLDSLIYLEYTYDSGDLLRDDDGHAILITWSLSF